MALELKYNLQTTRVNSNSGKTVYRIYNWINVSTLHTVNVRPACGLETLQIKGTNTINSGKNDNRQNIHHNSRGFWLPKWLPCVMLLENYCLSTWKARQFWLLNSCDGMSGNGNLVVWCPHKFLWHHSSIIPEWTSFALRGIPAGWPLNPKRLSGVVWFFVGWGKIIIPLCLYNQFTVRDIPCIAWSSVNAPGSYGPCSWSRRIHCLLDCNLFWNLGTGSGGYVRVVNIKSRHSSKYDVSLVCWVSHSIILPHMTNRVRKGPLIGHISTTCSGMFGIWWRMVSPGLSPSCLSVILWLFLFRKTLLAASTWNERSCACAICRVSRVWATLRNFVISSGWSSTTAALACQSTSWLAQACQCFNVFPSMLSWPLVLWSRISAARYWMRLCTCIHKSQLSRSGNLVLFPMAVAMVWNVSTTLWQSL